MGIYTHNGVLKQDAFKIMQELKVDEKIKDIFEGLMGQGFTIREAELELIIAVTRISSEIGLARQMESYKSEREKLAKEAETDAAN